MLLIILSLLANFSAPAVPPSTLELVFQLEDDEDLGGTLHIALYKSEADFDTDNSCFKTTEVVNSSAPVRVSVPDLPSATYAVAVYYDRNNNDKLDKNFFGIPKEPYGFISEPASKWRAPRWEEISDTIDEDREFVIKLQTWSQR